MALLAGPRLLGQTRSSDEDIQGPDKFERVPIWCFYNEFVHSGAFLPGMLAESAVKGVEIEPHLCYHRRRAGAPFIKSDGESRFKKVQIAESSKD